MSDRQNGGARGRGTAARGQTRMRMDDPSLNSSKRKREEEGGDPVLNLLSVILRIGDRLRVREGLTCVLYLFCPSTTA